MPPIRSLLSSLEEASKLKSKAQAMAISTHKYSHIYSRSIGLSHGAIVGLATGCTFLFLFFFLLFSWVYYHRRWLLLEKRRQVERERLQEEAKRLREVERLEAIARHRDIHQRVNYQDSCYAPQLCPSVILLGGGSTSYNPKELWRPSRMERDLELNAVKYSIKTPSTINVAMPMADLPRKGSVMTASSSTQEAVGADAPVLEEVRSLAEENKTESIPPPPALITAPMLKCCGKDFRTRAEYNRHKRYHDRPETCPHCPRTFGTSRDVNRHVNDIHQRTKIYHCLEATCERSLAGGGQGFPRKDNWRRHMRDVHGVGVEAS